MVAFFDYAGFSLHEAFASDNAKCDLRHQDESACPGHELDVHEIRVQIEETRANIADSLGLPAPQIFLTMGTTRGFKQLLLYSRWFPERGEVVVSDLIYPKMYNALEARCPHLRVAPVSTAANAGAAADCLSSLVGAKTSVVVVDAVDNRCGLAMNLRRLREGVQARNSNTRILLDASQAYGQLPHLAIASENYDFLVADLKKWCRYKSQKGLGFIAVGSHELATSLQTTANSQFALHPDWLPPPLVPEQQGSTQAGPRVSTVGRADAGGADLLSWSEAGVYVARTFAGLERPNQQRAIQFVEWLQRQKGPWRAWPDTPSTSMTGIVSLVGQFDEMVRLYHALLEQEIVCSLIPTNLPPQPAALGASEACLRFSFHDRETTDQEMAALFTALGRVSAL